MLFFSFTLQYKTIQKPGLISHKNCATIILKRRGPIMGVDLKILKEYQREPFSRHGFKPLTAEHPLHPLHKSFSDKKEKIEKKRERRREELSQKRENQSKHFDT